MCRRRQWWRTYKLSLNREVQSYFTRDLAMTPYGSPVRQVRGWCQLHRGWFVLNWLKGQSHSGSKSLGALTVSMGRKSTLRRDRRPACSTEQVARGNKKIRLLARGSV